MAYLVYAAAFQSTPSAREGDSIVFAVFPLFRVSIHAFREGRRRVRCLISLRVNCFNPRLPRGKATGWQCTTCMCKRFNPRLPRGKATGIDRGMSRARYVSIHAFREGRRPYRFYGRDFCIGFQSTPSAREGDQRSARHPLAVACFNPRLPRGKATWPHQSVWR